MRWPAGCRTRFFVVCSVAAGVLTACGGSPGATQAAGDLPSVLHGLPLVTVHEGEAAAEMIGTLHRTDVAPKDSRVAIYAVEELRAVLYRSRFATDSIAAAQFHAMTQRIGDGSFGFGHHTSMEVAGVEVHNVVGHGQTHSFFARGTDLIWLATPPMMERMMLAEVLEVDASQIPESPTPIDHPADTPSS